MDRHRPQGKAPAPLEGRSGDVEVAEPSIPLSRSEFLKTQLELKLAEDYVERKRWILAHADVTDEDVTPQLKQSVALILEGRADELDEDDRVKVAAFLHHSATPPVQERAVPLQAGPSLDGDL